MKFKKILQLGLSAIIITSFVAPSFASAEGNSSSTNSSNIKKNICVSDFTVKVNQKMIDQEAKLATTRAKRNNKLAANRMTREAKTATNRANWDASRVDLFAKAYGKPKTEARTKALADWNTAKTNAITAKRTAIDTANSVFKAGIDQLVANRGTSTDTAITTYKTAVSIAITAAQASCDAGTASKTVRAEFNQKLRAAKTQFLADKKIINQAQTGVETLAKAHRTSIAQAQKDFTTAINTAKTAFKAAWKAGALVKATTTPAQ